MVHGDIRGKRYGVYCYPLHGRISAGLKGENKFPALPSLSLVYGSRLYYVLYQLKTVGTLPPHTVLNFPEIDIFVLCCIRMGYQE